MHKCESVSSNLLANTTTKSRLARVSLAIRPSETLRTLASGFHPLYGLQDSTDILSAFIAHLAQRPLSNDCDLTAYLAGTEEL